MARGPRRGGGGRGGARGVGRGSPGGRSARRRDGGSGGGLLDPLLLPRLRQYAGNERVELRDSEEVANYLRGAYREYQRKQSGPFHKMVQKAIAILQQREGSEPAVAARDAEEQRLEALENSHMQCHRSSSDDDSDGNAAGTSGDNDSDIELQAQGHNLLNSELLRSYATGANDATTTTAVTTTNDNTEGDPAAAEPPAFAPPAAIAAAAAAAIATTKQLREQKQQSTPKPISNVDAEAANQPSTSTPARAVVKRLAKEGVTPSKRGVESVRKRQRVGVGDSAHPSLSTPQPTASEPQKVRFANLGGIEPQLKDIRELIEYPLKHPEVYEWLGVEPPRGVLLHGPPGCGKTMLAHAIANEMGVPFLRIAAPEVVSGMSGESEAKVRALFTEATRLAPCIVFIDEIDVIAPKRESVQREMERRIVAQLLTCMDDLSASSAFIHAAEDSIAEETAVSGLQSKHVVIIGATNRPDAMDPALRRAGRFDREIPMGIPDEAGRARILAVLTRKLRLDGTFDFESMARRTPGYVGADLAALCKEAAALAVTRVFQQLREPDAVMQDAQHEQEAKDSEQVEQPATQAMSSEEEQQQAAIATPPPDLPVEARRLGTMSPEQLRGLSITERDFELALDKVQPSAKREGFATIPGVSWDDVGALDDVREELSFSISQPIRNPERFTAMGLPLATGVLLYGPPGCGKTLVAKAIANECRANFISIKGPELLNKYVGESERAVRQLFGRARASAPCILFFDEMDAMAPRRGGADGNASIERVVNQLLTEMDGLEPRQSVFLISATNRPDMIDPAMLRPGRLDKLLYVPLPAPSARASILQTLVRSTPLDPAVNVATIASSYRCEGFSGADLAALLREACIAALKEQSALPGVDVTSCEPPRVRVEHFEYAFKRVFPSVSKADQRQYEQLRWKLRRSRSHIHKDEDVDANVVAIDNTAVNIASQQADDEVVSFATGVAPPQLPPVEANAIAQGLVAK